MEKSRKIITENSTTIQTVANTIFSLLSEVVSLNEKNVATLESKGEVVPEKVLQHTHVNKAQCAILCTLNKIVIDVEALLLSGCECNACEADAHNKLVKNSKSPSEIQETEKVEIGLPQNEKETNNLCSPERESVNEMSGSTQDIAKTIKNYERNYKQNNEVQLAHFKPSGKRTTSTNNKTKSCSSGCYDIRGRTLPLVNSYCVISHMESPSEFYIHTIDEEVVHIDGISNIIGEAYSNTKCRFKCKSEIYDELGLFCVVYIKKFEQWYRAELLDWLLDDCELVQIQLIDYGLRYHVPYYDLRPMLPEVSIYPKLAQLCHLHCLCPLNQEDCKREEYDWPMTTIETYLDILGPSLDVEFQIVFVKNCGNSVGIDLLKNGEESSISEQLLKLGIAAVTLIDEKEEELRNTFMAQQVLEAQGILGLPPMSETEKMARFLDTALPLETTEDINEAVAYYSPTDEKRICKFQTKCRKKNCRFEHAPLTKGFTTDRLPVFNRAIDELHLPKGGDTITLRFTYIKTVCNFYIHLNPFTHDLVYSQYTQMEEMMNDPNTVKTYKSMKILPALGEIVIVKNWDGRWCRAQVRDHTDTGSTDLQVFIVDYGEVVDVKLSDVREIREEFLQIPFQAVECRLFNVTINDNASPVEAKEYMEFHCMCKNYKAQVVSANVGYLELLVFVENGEDLGENLIRKGFAIAKPERLIPVENDCFLVD